MRKHASLFTTVFLLLSGCLHFNAMPASAQSTAERNTGRRGSEAPGIAEPGLNFISAEMQFGGKVVKGAPYSAEISTETIQTLSDGTKLTRRTTGLVYRDRFGRTRREMAVNMNGPFATKGDTPRMIFINDPVAGLTATILPDSNTVQTKPLSAGNQPAPPDNEPVPANSRIESLDKQLIEGIEAAGTRTTMTIPAGQLGNDLPLEIVQERWYSPQLQTIMLSKHSDPRWGVTVYKLLNIKLGVPAPSLFLLPVRPTKVPEPSLAELEKQLSEATNPATKFHLLTKLAPAAFKAGEFEKARRYALELLNQAALEQKSWNYGNAIHVGNLVLGRCALQADNINQAKEYLLAAGRTPGSPTLNSFGPDMLLAKELLSKGEHTVVLQYFELCATFWKRPGEKLEDWKALINGGRTPNFGANLVYIFGTQ